MEFIIVGIHPDPVVFNSSAEKHVVFLTIIPLVFSSERGVYHQSPGIAGLHYIALGIGLTGAAQLNSRTMDRIYLILKERYGEGKGRPEFRVRECNSSCPAWRTYSEKYFHSIHDS